MVGSGTDVKPNHWNEPLPKSLSREEEEEEEEEDGLQDRMTDIVWLGKLSSM